VIITGGNTGIGEAIGRRVLSDDVHLIIVARRETSAEFSALARERKAVVSFVKMDLLKVDNLGNQFTNEVMSKISEQDVKSIWFFQNAGLLITKRVGEQSFDDVRDLLLVNTVAPAILAEAFVRHVQTWPVEKKMICISSGAARKCYEGWWAYGSSKAAIDHQCRILQVEQKRHQHPVVAVAYGPGVTETSMQERVRASDQTIPAVASLTKMKEDGKVFPAARAAEILVGFIESSKYGRSPTEDVYDLLDEEKK